MHETNGPVPRKQSRKLLWLALAILIVLAGYSAVWFVLAGQMKSRLATVLDQPNTAGVAGQCTDMDVRGFPFRIGVFCNQVKVDDTRHGISASFGALRSAAQVYAPGHSVLELDGPAEIRMTPGTSISANWTQMQASAVVNTGGLNRTSLAYKALAGTVVTPMSPDSGTFSAEQGEMHVRANGDDVDIAMSVNQLRLKVPEVDSPVPPVNASADLTILGRAPWLASATLPADPLYGTSGTVRAIQIDLGEGLIANASGPFRVSDVGVVSGEFKLSLNNVDAWRTQLTAVAPDQASIIKTATKLMKALSNGSNDASVTINVRDGTAFLGFIPIGKLPPL